MGKYIVCTQPEPHGDIEAAEYDFADLMTHEDGNPLIVRMMLEADQAGSYFLVKGV